MKGQLKYQLALQSLRAVLHRPGAEIPSSPQAVPARNGLWRVLPHFYILATLALLFVLLIISS